MKTDIAGTYASTSRLGAIGQILEDYDGYSISEDEKKEADLVMTILRKTFLSDNRISDFGYITNINTDKTFLKKIFGKKFDNENYDSEPEKKSVIITYDHDKNLKSNEQLVILVRKKDKPETKPIYKGIEQWFDYRIFIVRDGKVVSSIHFDKLWEFTYNEVFLFKRDALLYYILHRLYRLDNIFYTHGLVVKAHPVKMPNYALTLLHFQYGDDNRFGNEVCVHSIRHHSPVFIKKKCKDCGDYFIEIEGKKIPHDVCAVCAYEWHKENSPEQTESEDKE